MEIHPDMIDGRTGDPVPFPARRDPTTILEAESADTSIHIADDDSDTALELIARDTEDSADLRRPGLMNIR